MFTIQAGKELEIQCEIVISNYTSLTPVINVMQHYGQKGPAFRSPASSLGFPPLCHPPPLPANLRSWT